MISPRSRGVASEPRATYRLQFNKDFTLAQARELVEYLAELGASHVYSSPLLKAIPGSTHGYDACDFTRINPEIGTTGDLEKLHEALARHGMGLVLDVVPNHMGIDLQNNPWWLDVLTHGSNSTYANYFDINWQAADPRLRGKIALPIMGERYHEALAKKAIQLTEKKGKLALEYNGMTLPVSPESVAATFGNIAEGRSSIIAKINGDPAALDEFIQKQNYLMMSWRNGDSMLNYRRFFTIASLAAVRIEEQPVFDQAFSCVKQWLQHGWIDGLRVDHSDGLRYPEQFLNRLRDMAPNSWIVIEKILEPGEGLNPDWPVNGTTGYDFLINLNGVFVDPKGEKPLSDFYKEFTGDNAEYADVVRAEKIGFINNQLLSEANRLTDLLVHIAARHWQCRDFTRAELREAWSEVATCIPVYRTYTGANDVPVVSEIDQRIVKNAATAASAFQPQLPRELFKFLEDLLLFRHRGQLEDDFVLRFQQLTGALMAKSIEDTAFYCYLRFVALNEVGGDPGKFGMSLPDFHAWCRAQQEIWPTSMVASATHDTKWGSDVRARLAVLSEQPQRWIEAVRRWSKLNEARRHEQFPDRKTEYLFYQALAGAWPVSKERLLAHMQKAVREAKENTDWGNPNPQFEEALKNFVTRAMEDAGFMADVEKFVATIVEAGWKNSLSQTAVKLTATGVPDIYQGTELWDFSLTDPDNRRPVDYEPRKRMLAEAKQLSAQEAWKQRESGMPKLWLIAKLLELRKSDPEIFGPACAYEPLFVSGTEKDRILAYIRGGRLAVIAPRFVSEFNGKWGNTTVPLPSGNWKNFLTGASIKSGDVDSLLDGFPVAVLVREEKA